MCTIQRGAMKLRRPKYSKDKQLSSTSFYEKQEKIRTWRAVED
jgi:hypothetical protein